MNTKKSLLISIKPKYVAKILNGEKTIEIRKTMPKCDLPIDVYVYCTKEKPLYKSYIRMGYYTDRSNADDLYYQGRGKVVAKFTLNKVEGIKPNISLIDNEINTFLIDSKIDVLEASCLTEYEMEKYLCPNYDGDRPLEYFGKVVGYAWHIDNLEIFDEPRYLYSFYKVGSSAYKNEYDSKKFRHRFAINKAPQSYMFIEVEKRGDD